MVKVCNVLLPYHLHAIWLDTVGDLSNFFCHVVAVLSFYSVDVGREAEDKKISSGD